MKIVGVEERDGDDCTVQTIDVWFSGRRQAWIAERLDAEGNQIGAAHLCRDEADAAACVAEWLRAHGDIRLVAAFEAPAAAASAQRRALPRHVRRRAA